MKEPSELEKKIGYDINKLVGHLCCENCYKHYVMALSKLTETIDVKHLHDTVIFVSQKKSLPTIVQNIFDRKLEKLEEEKKNVNKKHKASQK